MAKKQLQGVVVSTKMAKTVVVDVGRMRVHPKYKKRSLINKKYKAHYEGSDVALGDRVIIEETRPLSKDKRWQVIEVISRTAK